MIEYERESIEDLAESVQELYEKDGDKFKLKIDGLPKPEKEDVSGLKAKVDELLTEAKKAKAKAREAAEEAEQAKVDAAKKGNDTEALDNSWKAKYSSRETELQEQIDSLTNTVVSLTSGQTATEIASEIAIQGSAQVLLPHIEKRLKTEHRDGKPQTIVLDDKGQPSAMTVDELKTEFQNDAAFAPLIVGTKANGAGRTGGKESGGATDQ